MDIKNLIIDANRSVGKNLVLVDVAPIKSYVDGRRIDEVSGYDILSLCLTKRLTNLW